MLFLEINIDIFRFYDIMRSHPKTSDSSEQKSFHIVKNSITYKNYNLFNEFMINNSS
jgi:hypothetical protein